MVRRTDYHRIEILYVQNTAEIFTHGAWTLRELILATLFRDPELCLVDIAESDAIHSGVRSALRGCDHSPLVRAEARTRPIQLKRRNPSRSCVV